MQSTDEYEINTGLGLVLSLRRVINSGMLYWSGVSLLVVYTSESRNMIYSHKKKQIFMFGIKDLVTFTDWIISWHKWREQIPNDD